MDPFVAEIRIFAGNFAPKGWAQCNGQLLPLSQNTALFALLGTFYGGDGKSTFALPNLQGSAPLGWGDDNPGGSDYFIGQQAGAQFVTLLQSEIPFHTHFARSVNETATLNTPDPARSLAKSANGFGYYGEGINGSPAPTLTNMNFQEISIAGGSLPHNNMMPYLTLNFIIAMQGVFPPRQ
jgi:microcystin-dependent protein